jgi:hypothetical protein
VSAPGLAGAAGSGVGGQVPVQGRPGHAGLADQVGDGRAVRAGLAERVP